MPIAIHLSALQAAALWNSAILLALAVALFVQYLEIKRLKLDVLSSFVVIAAVNAALLLGLALFRWNEGSGCSGAGAMKNIPFHGLAGPLVRDCRPGARFPKRLEPR